jgi:hypothetical protein
VRVSLAVLLLAAGSAVALRRAPVLELRRSGRLGVPTVHRLTEAEARARFAREHPGEKPLNWAIAEAAPRFRQSRPMGRFVLGLGGRWGNDCSDFTAACVDEGLGAGARFKRASKHHIYGEDARLFEWFWWRPGATILPGDQLHIRHSPWYTPSEDACWHVGLVGPDGQVYDFTKLKRWNGPRYGRNSVDWFTRHSRGAKQVLVSRLHWKYRYRVEPLPKPSQAADRSDSVGSTDRREG